MNVNIIDKQNNREETIAADDLTGYSGLWKIIDEIIEKYNYSILYYLKPELDDNHHIITIHWVELLEEVSEAYIKITNVPESILYNFKRAIRSMQIKCTKTTCNIKNLNIHKNICQNLK